MDKPVLMIAPPYDEATLKTICDGFSRMYGQELEFEVIEDEKLLGGFIAIIDGKVYDTSLSSRLYDVSRQLVNEVG